MLIDELRDRYRTSLTKTCALFVMSRSRYQYQSVARDSPALLMHVKKIAAVRAHCGYRRVHAVLQLECLNAHWFLSLADAQSKIDGWRTYYHEVPPRSALPWMTLAEFTRRARESTFPDIAAGPEISSSGRDALRFRVNSVPSM
uniref:integrase core domain-containing protein n=1 Tax=Burkholderia anthina TaxID=179879 RepID=UPI001FC85A66|nr:integrase core domain-containing protein [Burkholderia anthina]